MESRLTSHNVFPSLAILMIATGTLIWYSSLSTNIRELIYWLPYGFATIITMLALQFNRRQLFVVALVNTFSYWLIVNYLQQPLAEPTASTCFTVLGLFIPFNLFLNQLVKDNGWITRRALVWYICLALQMLSIPVIIDFFALDMQGMIKQWFSPRPLEGLVISLNALGFIMFCLVISFIRFINKPTSISIGLFFSFLASTFPLIFLDREAISSIFFTASMLIMLFSGFNASHELAYRDELTGLLGRRMLFERLAGLSKNYCLAMVDIDHFKKFNDTYGHDVGDDVLAMVAAKLDQIEGGGQVFRYGGEEFTVLFKGKQLEHAKIFLDDIRELIAQTPFAIRDNNSRNTSDKSRRGEQPEPKNTVQITVSIGVAEKSNLHASAEEVIKDADNALYEAKKKGRNVVIG
ncbi:GGDEF domain-containing protein [Agarivorans sp. QJM3NY_33]|uniref:GGDEF domain-containing protein n=1 Tax=Agarivorans sp. QJM3NY_33 TaxID=3421432 RepID=UPI003F6D908C